MVNGMRSVALGHPTLATVIIVRWTLALQVFRRPGGTRQ